MKKRVLSLLLVMIMVVTILPSNVIVAFAEESDLTAHTFADKILQENLVPENELEVFTSDPEELAVLTECANNIVAGLTTDYDKIEAVCKYVAENIYYDYDYYYDRTQNLYLYPYEVLINGYTVCDGYERLSRELLRIAGVPCIRILGEDHAYCAAYDSASGKWIYFDSTWCSQNKYENGEKIQGDYYASFFDMSLYLMNYLGNHEIIIDVELIQRDFTYKLVMPDNDFPELWRDIGNWYLSVAKYDGNASELAINQRDEIYNLPIKVINRNGFRDCTSITKLIIPEGVTTIGETAFFGCSSLKDIVLPESLTTIEYLVFRSTALENVFYAGTESQWESIYIDYYNDELLNAKIHYNSTDHTASDWIVGEDSSCLLGGSRYKECTVCGKKLEIESVGELGEHTSSDWIIDVAATCTEDGSKHRECVVCGEILETEEIIHEGHSWSEWTLYDEPTCYETGEKRRNCTRCSELDLDIVDSVDHDYSLEYTIDSMPTCYQDGMKSRHCRFCDTAIDVTIMPATNHIGKCYCYEYAVISETDKMIEITKYLGVETNIEIPSTIDGYTVTSIGDDAFAYCESLTSITIPDSVKTIGDSAFCGCDILTSVTIGNGITTIGEMAFNACHKLSDITIPDSVTEIAPMAFHACTSLTSITVDNNNEYYSNDEFGVLFNKNKTELIQYPIGNTRTDYTIPDSVISIGDYAFRLCRNLTSITIPKSVTEISNNAFSHCDNLTDILIPDSITIIGNSAFSCCDSLTSISIPDSITTIHGDVFSGCVNLVSVTIPDSVAIIGDYAFQSCNKLTDVYYSGTEEKWNTILIYDGNECLINATIHFNSTRPILNGWVQENGKWVYYQNNVKVKNTWMKDSVGWCYLGADGYMLTNSWVKDSVGWCYVGTNGYCVTNCWKKDSKGWCYLDANGRMATNKWIKDSVGWCYVGADGYCVTNKWVKDSVGWCYLDANGRMATNKWIKDSQGWCYVGADGYCLTNTWKKDSQGWCYLDSNGRMVYNNWVYYNNQWYYLDENGYMVTGTRVINGKTYNFNSSGVWIG